MRRKLFISMMGLLCVHCSFAQEWSDTLNSKNVFIRFNPTGLLNLMDQNLSFGSEFSFNKNWAVAIDASWIFYSYEIQETPHTAGYVFRPAVRYYIGKKRNRYLEAELHYKNVTYKLTDWVGHDCVNHTPAYEEFMNYRLRKEVLGYHIKTGILYELGTSGRFLMEVYAGIGTHYRNFSVAGKPGCCVPNRTNPLGVVTDGNNISVAVPAGVRFLYRVK
jgi:hypothetical protein